MSLKDIQQDVDTWASQFKIPYWNPLEIMCRMTEELGELARVSNRLYGPKKSKTPEEDRRNLGEEIGDLLMTISCYANREDIDLDIVWKNTLDKLYGRDNHRFERKDEK